MKQVFRFRDADKRSPISQIMVVVTADVAGRYGGLENIAKQLREFIARSGVTLPNGVVAADWLQVVAPANQSAEALYKIARTTPRRGVVIAAAAAMYRDRDAKPVASSANVGLYEDFWVPHLTSIARNILAIASQTESYVALIAGEQSPRHRPMGELLLSVDRVGVVSATMSDDLEQMLAAHDASLGADFGGGADWINPAHD